MPRDPGLYLEDMVEAIERIETYLRGVDRPGFATDRRTLDAVIRNLEIFGEAAKHVPDAVRIKAPEIDWRKAAGLRDVLAHSYFRVDLDIVWDAATTKIPALLMPLRRLLESLGSD